MRKLAPARVSYRDDFLISYQVYISTRDSKSQTLRMRYPFQSIGRPIFTPKRVVVSRLHDTAARFRTGVKFAPRYRNLGELTPGSLAPALHFVVVSCRKNIET